MRSELESSREATTKAPYQGRELVLSTREFAVERRGLSWYYVLSTFFLMVVAISGTFLNVHWGFKLAFSILAGLLIVRFFVLYHDYQHGAILKDSWLGSLLMNFFGILILAPPTVWKKTHNHHHKHNSKLSNHGIGDFPILEKKTFQKLSKRDKKIYLFTRHPLTIFLGYLSVFMFDFNIKTFLENPKNHLDSLVALMIHFSLGTLIFLNLGWMGLIFSFLIPFVIACGLGAYLFYVQHNFPLATFNENRKWNYFEAALESSSHLNLNPIMRWFTANIGYHHVHHVNHLIPFYNLPKTMGSIDLLKNPKQVTFSPSDIVSCLKLKVWDEEKGKLTGVN